jgi:ABC-type multidrug transport system fused ATPase/permease subunit
LLPYLRPYWKLAVISVILILLGAALGLLGPWPMAFVVDNVIDGKPLPWPLDWLLGPLEGNFIALLLVGVLAGLAITVLHQLMDLIDNYVNTKLELRMSLDIRSDLFAHVQRLSLARHDQRRSGMLIYCVNNQGDAGPRLIMTVPSLATSILTLVGMLYILICIDWQLALLSLIVVPFLYYSVGYYVKHIQERIYHVRAMEGETLSIIHEVLSMIRVIVAFGREKYEHTRYRKQGERAVDARVKITVRQALFTLCVDTITAIGGALVLFVAACHIHEGVLTVGTLWVVLHYLHQVYKPLESISSTIGHMQEMFISLRMVFEIMDTPIEVKDRPDAKQVERALGHVVYEEVGFSYQQRVDTLKEISLEAFPGQVIGIVGQTGAGKTTLVSLLPRFYDLQQGRILLDGTDIRDLTVQSLRQQVSMVLQEPLLFSGTIADNIRYGRLEANMDEIVLAAQAANAHDFIMALPNKYDTELGERGAKLSGGERQRIAVARAFLKDAPILILDEPTSSIDSKTEAVILDALERLMAGRTTFMIAHRLSTIRKADKLLVLDQGRLVEQGTHDELLENGGLFRQMYDLQAGTVDERVLEEPEPEHSEPEESEEVEQPA